MTSVLFAAAESWRPSAARRRLSWKVNAWLNSWQCGVAGLLLLLRVWHVRIHVRWFVLYSLLSLAARVRLSRWPSSCGRSSSALGLRRSCVPHIVLCFLCCRLGSTYQESDKAPGLCVDAGRETARFFAHAGTNEPQRDKWNIRQNKKKHIYIYIYIDIYR